MNTQNNANATLNQNSTLIDRIPMQGSPFWQIQTEQGFMLTMGHNIMTPIFETEEKLDKYIINNHWDIVSLLILTLIDISKNKEIQKYINLQNEAEEHRKQFEEH